MTGLTLYTLQDAERVIASNLHRLRNFDTIVGVPRSGSIFAAFIATQLGIALADVGTAGRSIRVAKHGHVKQEPLGRVLLVDDVVNKGIALGGAFEVLRQTMPGLRRSDVTTCALWTNPHASPDSVDISMGGEHAARYCFTWQMWHSTLWPTWATDFDGVFCEDPPVETSHDEDAYRRWISNAVGRWLPRPRNQKYSIGAIITSRPEGVRLQTEDWLRRHGIVWQRLVMVPVETQAAVKPWMKAQRFSRGEWKAREAQKIGGLEMFVESHVKHAVDISRMFSGLTWCTDTQERYRGGVAV